ncbi:MAG TPA: hypothetical protein VKO20_10395 [Desulfosalsimonadaceae bacterium]|nr:hypothetical protein [Desulfosalsimonadaceae bacterium]
MKKAVPYIAILACFCFCPGLQGALADGGKAGFSKKPAPFGPARLAGRLGDERLAECSGMDAALGTDDLFWAINDSGNGAFIYALGKDGGSRGRILIEGAANRDWEGIDTFAWKGRPMILIADFGDNRKVRDTCTLYITEEPRLQDGRFGNSATVEVAWRIVFTYPDGSRDAEGVAVDAAGQKVLVLSKRDKPPLLFELPLKPAASDMPLTARNVAKVDRIPPPSKKDLLQQYGKNRSQPTALDLSPDGRRAVVLTYKHAYLFPRRPTQSWADALRGKPVVLPLPLPQNRRGFAQREAICFTPDGQSLLVTAEGKQAEIFQLPAR